MDGVQIFAALADAGMSAVLLAVLWQGLKRFDALLQVVINLALLNSDRPELREQAAKKLQDTANGR